MLVSNIMSKCVAECTEDMGLEEVFELIQKCDHGLVVVIDSLAHRVPIGVVSERSICEQVITRGKNPRNLSAGSVLDSRIKKVRETDSVESIGEASELAAIVVIDDKRRVCGIVAKDAIKGAAEISEDPFEPAVDGVTAPQTLTHGFREIPAFGWIQ